MRIKVDKSLTKNMVKKLIASKPDSQHWQLRIDKKNYAYLSEDIGAEKLDNVAHRFGTWCKGKGYVGPDAAADEEWVGSVFDRLKKVNPNRCLPISGSD